MQVPALAAVMERSSETKPDETVAEADAERQWRPGMANTPGSCSTRGHGTGNSKWPGTE
jgi:hypothetical protein